MGKRFATMALTTILPTLLASAGGNSLLISGAIIVGTFVLEDPTTVMVGVLVADGGLSMTLALVSLYTGIVLGDIFLYTLGRLASSHPRLERFVDHSSVAPFKLWLEERFVLTIFSVRFIPGLRLPTYTASGFFRTPLTKFIGIAIGATSVWTTGLFFASYLFGNFTSEWLGWVRYGIAAVFVVSLFLFGRYNLQKKKMPKKSP